jgi:hypothetical protein
MASSLRARSYGHFWSPKRERRRRAWRLKRWRDRKLYEVFDTFSAFSGVPAGAVAVRA